MAWSHSACMRSEGGHPDFDDMTSDSSSARSEVEATQLRMADMEGAAGCALLRNLASGEDFSGSLEK
jgi:hypothetical protein